MLLDHPASTQVRQQVFPFVVIHDAGHRRQYQTARALKEIISHYQWQLGEAIALARAYPESAFYRGRLFDLLGSYARYAAEYRAAINEIPQLAHRDPDLRQPIYPSPAQTEAVIAKIAQDAQNRNAAASAQNAAAMPMAIAPEILAQGPFAAPLVQEASAELLQILMQAKNIHSTATDGHILLAAVDKVKSARKSAYQQWKEHRLGELVSEHGDMAAARSALVVELKVLRAETISARQKQCDCEKSACRLGRGLVAGTVQQGRADLPLAIDRHASGKQAKKTAEMQRQILREKLAIAGNNPRLVQAMQNSLADHYTASIRMTMGIFRELTAQFMAEGYAPKDARSLAKARFQQVHEERIGLVVADKKRWRAGQADGYLTELAVDKNAMSTEMVEYRERVNARIRDRQLLEQIAAPRPVATRPQQFLPDARRIIRHDAAPRAAPGDGHHRQPSDGTVARILRDGQRLF